MFRRTAATRVPGSAVLRDVLYGVLHWDARPLAQKHGLSRSAINRIFVKHGVVRGRWGGIDIKHLRVFTDPLFGVTVSSIAGLYYGTHGVLALAATSRAFPELHLLAMNSAILQSVEAFLGELRKFSELRKTNLVVITTAVEQDWVSAWLKTIDDRREVHSEIHLLTHLPDNAPLGISRWFKNGSQNTRILKCTMPPS